MRKWWNVPAFVGVVLALALGMRGSAQTPAGPSPAVTEELIAEKDAAAPQDDDEDLVSADGRHAAWRTGRESKWAVMLDGKRQGGEFSEVKWLEFSSDGQHLAFAARRDKSWLMVLDGKESAQPFERISAPQFIAIVSGPRFSHDGKRIVYAARRGKDDEVVVVDGQPGPRFASIVAGPRFCDEGRHVAYVASEAGGARFLIVDSERVGGALLQEADFVSSLTFAPDGKRVGCIGIAGSFWAGSGPRSLGGSGKGVGRSAKRRVYVDGQPGPEYDARGVSGLEFSPDSRHVAYVVHGLQEGSRRVSFVVTNRTEGRRYDAVWTRTLGLQNAGAAIYVAQSGRKFLRVTQSVR